VRPDERIVDPSSRYGAVVNACLLREDAWFEDVLWFRGLSRWGLEVVVRAGIAMLRAFPTDSRWVSSEALRDYWEALDAWLAEPSLEAYQLVERRVTAVYGANAPISRGALFLSFLQSSGDMDESERRRDLLGRVETAVGSQTQHMGRPDLVAIGREVSAWALSAAGRSRLEDDRPDHLPEGPTLRQRVVEAETSITRLEAINALCRADEEEVTVVMADGEEFVAYPAGAGIQDFYAGTPAGLCAVSLDGVAEIRLGTPGDGIVS